MPVETPMIKPSNREYRRATTASGTASTSPSSTAATVIVTCSVVALMRSSALSRKYDGHTQLFTALL